MGAALATIPSQRYDWGHSWLVDTEDTYQEKMGEAVSLPPMPKRLKEVPTTSSFTILKQYKHNLVHYLICDKLRTTDLTIIKHKFPMSLEHKKTRYGLPHNLILQEALEFKEFYDKSFLEKEEDDILRDHRGKARSATIAIAEIQARLADLQSTTA